MASRRCRSINTGRNQDSSPSYTQTGRIVYKVCDLLLLEACICPVAGSRHVSPYDTARHGQTAVSSFSRHRRPSATIRLSRPELRIIGVMNRVSRTFHCLKPYRRLLYGPSVHIMSISSY